MDNQSKAAESSRVQRVKALLCGGPIWRRAAAGVAGLALLVCLFYQEENWRGRHAWARSQARAAGQGLVTDWKEFIPPSVPADQNFFAAKNMQEWFVARSAAPANLSQRAATQNFFTHRQQAQIVVAEVTCVRSNDPALFKDADLALKYDEPTLTVLPPEQWSTNAEATDPVIPLMVMDAVPLTYAIKNLAIQAQIKYRLDPHIDYGLNSADGSKIPEPEISVRWENLSARAALQAVLKNYNLVMIPNAKTGIARIKVKDASALDVCMEDALTNQLEKLVRDRVWPVTNGMQGGHLTSTLGFQFVGEALAAPKPARIVVRTEKIPPMTEVKQFFPKHPVGGSWPLQSEIQALSTGSNSFEIYLYPSPFVPAKDFLAWSDQFEGDFDDIREASKRPYARMEGDYREAEGAPSPNYMCVRVISQTLAQRAQCHLLAGEPEKALRDLECIRGICRALEARPTGRPVTLVAAMINSAVTSLYADTIGDGLHLHAWREQELTALEDQLKEVNLPPLLGRALDYERASSCRVLEGFTPENYDRVIAGPERRMTREEKMRDPTFLILTFAPRGWVYQNMATISAIHQLRLGGIDAAHDRMLPHWADDAVKTVHKKFEHPTAYSILAAALAPNYTRASQYIARNQTLANEARISCALERHHLARGQYPETLEALVPQFIDQLPRDIISGQPLKYSRKGESFTLYSIGWNERDDGGVSAMKRDGSGDITKADWVWLNDDEATN